LVGECRETKNPDSTVAPELPGTAIFIGHAFNPLQPGAGLQSAVDLVGLDRVRQVAELLVTFDGTPVTRLTDMVALCWCSSTPMGPVLAVLRGFEQNAAMTVLAASAVARTEKGIASAALERLAPGVRALAGLPSKAEIDASFKAD
jgi:hypothetical protein